jgi:hypothetical protein
MKKYRGGELVPQGVYLNLSTLELVQLYGDTRLLPGSGEVKYLKTPAALAVVAGPFVGLAFIIFLPLIGILGIIGFLGYKSGQWVQVFGRKALQPAIIGWKPGISYLTRRGGTPKGEEPAKGAPGGLTELEQEIARRRQRGEK